MNCPICGANVKIIGKTTMNYENLDKVKIEKLESKLKIAEKGLEFINATAPAMHKYNEIELRMIMNIRKVLRKIKELDKGE